MPEKKLEKNKGPKTSLDAKFLALASEVMKTRGITSDRAISQELDRHPDFINRIRRGLQSATPGAWDTLFDKYPEARNITNVTAHSGGQAIGTNHGTVSQDNWIPSDPQGIIAGLEILVEQLRQQVADRDKLIASQEVTIASKEEIISLLRGRIK
jgi:hypothetical protein